MTATKTNRFRDQLRTLAARVGGTAADLEEQVRSPTGGEAGGGLSNAPLHLGDIGSEVYAQELNATLLENETHIRDEAIAALERIDAGTFGTCEACGNAIPAERLDALPYARHCVGCAAALQSGSAVNMNNGRPTNRNGGANPKDAHAAGTPGGGGPDGGLAGTNAGRGDPENAASLEDALATGTEPVKRTTRKRKM